MTDLLKAALLPALTMLAGRFSSSLSTTNGVYAGVDFNAGRPFAGLQGRLDPNKTSFQVVPSAEKALLSASGRWQFNTDALYRFGGAGGASLVPYAGAGLCMVGAAGKEGRSLGVNVIGGASFALGSLRAFAQARLTVADGVHLSLTGGATPKSR